jgi:hypothetical protein
MRSGVMIRSGGTDPQAPYYGVFATPSHGVIVQWRSGEAGLTSQFVGPASTAPVFVEAARYTDTTHNVVYYSAYTSADGVTWTYMPGSTVALNLPGPLAAGLASDANSSLNLTVATFDSVAQGAPVAPPNVCPSAWTCADIGTVAPGPGSQTLSGGNWSVTGFGNDIWGSADSFRFAYRSLAADGSISAQIVSQTNSSAWAKAGLMMRATADPGSPYYAVFATPGNGIAVQWRAAQGGTTGQVTTPGTLPLYVEIVRSGTTYSAYTSPDGGTWTLVPGSTQTLASLTGSLLEGLAVNSHNTGQLSTVVYSAVATS